jgi:class 3 adenylate cyclase
LHGHAFRQSQDRLGLGQAVSPREVHNLGIESRSGLHTGEVEIIGDDVGGISIHAAARILTNARANEVWTSRTVRDLVAGSQFKFREQGTYNLRGISGDWPLFTVEA